LRFRVRLKWGSLTKKVKVSQPECAPQGMRLKIRTLFASGSALRPFQA
jgi:hypothetical protein